MTTDTNPDAKGKSLLFAVRWFVTKYRSTAEERSLDEYAETCLKKIEGALAWRTHQEAK